ncbi:ISL3 family transposase [Streptococcus pneumoniae]|uniref:ISL3 family transposase n=1 Tax=Streptococcus pneumoniae TaxID=1313 RepID=UPI00067A7671|nr:ISL3 family transposase [Streptococcus pneumoniae]
MEQLHFITKLLDIKDPNIKILDIINMDTHKEIIAKLDYEAPSCPDCGSLMKKYDFQKPSKIPYLETTGMPSRILLRKRRFKCYHCSKMMVAETPLVKKNHQIPRIINQKIAQKLIEKISMTDIAHQLQLDRKSHEYKAIKRYWKLIQQDSRKLSDKHFYRPTFRMHLTNKEILNKLLSYSQDLKHHYQLYQLLLFHFQNKEPEKFFGLIEDNLKQVHPLFQTVFKTFLKDKEKIVNALQLHYSNAKLEATNNLIKLIKRNAFGFRNFENFKKRIFIALNIKKERTKFVLSRA